MHFTIIAALGLIPFLKIIFVTAVPLIRPRDSSVSESYASLRRSGPVVSPYYLYFGNPQTKKLTDAFDKPGLKAATVGFVSAPKGKCQLTTDLDGLVDDVKSFVTKGGAVSLSFGGNLADQTVPRQHIQQACTDVTALANLIKDTMSKFNTHNIEFDIENDFLTSDKDAATRLAQALVKVKKDISDTFVTYTLGTFPTSMATDQTFWVQATKDNGVELDAVVLMTMDFGSLGSGDNVKDSQSAVTAGASTLASIYNISSSDAMKKMGVLPAIGTDDDHRVLTLDGASTLGQFAKSSGMSIVSYWSFNRDFPGAIYATTQSLNASSSPDQETASQFLTTFQSATSGAEQKTTTASGSDTDTDSDSPSSGFIRLGLGPSESDSKKPPTPINKQPGQKASLPDPNSEGAPGGGKLTSKHT